MCLGPWRHTCEMGRILFISFFKAEQEWKMTTAICLLLNFLWSDSIHNVCEGGRNSEAQIVKKWRVKICVFRGGSSIKCLFAFLLAFIYLDCVQMNKAKTGSKQHTNIMNHVSVIVLKVCWWCQWEETCDRRHQVRSLLWCRFKKNLIIRQACRFLSWIFKLSQRWWMLMNNCCLLSRVSMVSAKGWSLLRCSPLDLGDTSSFGPNTLQIQIRSAITKPTPYKKKNRL